MTNQSATILIIDDDDDLRQTMADGLESLGYTVLQSDNYQNVFHKLPTMMLSAIILDFMLDDDSGVTLLNYVRKNKLLKNVKVIMISGFDHAKAAAELWGADAFLHKPVSIVQLNQTLQKLIISEVG